MATAVDIANLALAHLGDEATIASLDPPEGSAQAEHCARFFPIARDTLLEMHPWKFAVSRTTPALLAPTSSAWQYAYAVPARCITVLGLLPEGYTNEMDDIGDFTLEISDDANDTPLLLCNVENATIRYVKRIEDTSKFTPLFTEALAWLLASYIAGPLIKGDVGEQAGRAAWASFMAFFARATASSANQGRGQPKHTPPWIVARS